MKGRLETAVNVAILIAALAVAATAVRRPAPAHQPTADSFAESYPPSQLAEWQDVLKDGLTIDGADAPATIAVFSDLECPFCASLHLGVLAELKRKYGGDLRIVFVHFPIRSHRFSNQAATALECAAIQGSQSLFLETVYSLQDSIGLKPWDAYGRAAKVADIPQFEKCIAEARFERIERGRQWATELGLTGTPTIFLNGWRFSSTADVKDFESAIDAILAGNNPFPPDANVVR